MKRFFRWWILIAALAFAGCRTYVEYYPPTPEFNVKVKGENGEVKEIRGAIQKEGTEPDLGTEGLGEYYLIKGSVL